ncbi:MAG TPA: hypothetical protein VGZ32_02895 [Actinocrinis sp.]|uniref:hypothetical protein n=1 Tax=Actinocrinis sp. TaxID=1920516 RepID=UPI002DDD6309|nr:hypothetical protein [Actinocrinis sp.]HEV3169253.1 hypothetical protein [Actinocrinis sp.]
MRIRHALGVTAAFVLAAAVVGPVNAATTGNTTTTFTVAATGTGLAITVPASAALGTGAPGSTITAHLGSVQVTDSRAVNPAAWTASVTSTDFTNAAVTADTIPATDVNYWSGPTTATAGSGTFTPGQPLSGGQAPLNNTTPLTAMSLTGGAGSNSASWNPTLVVNVPAAAVAGTYSGTVTHSVA